MRGLGYRSSPTPQFARSSVVFPTEDSFYTMRRNSRSFSLLFGSLFYISVLTLRAASQTASSSRADAASSDGYFWPFVLIAIALSAFGVAYLFWRKSQRAIEVSQYNYGKFAKKNNKNEPFERGGAAKEMEWLRKTRKTGAPYPVSKTSNYGNKPDNLLMSNAPASPDLDRETMIFQEKMRRQQYAQLPINSFIELSPATLYEPLPMSDDSAVLDAIEQTNDEYEKDEAVRDLALRILTAFRTRNSVEALSQIALYDLSSNLRSKAVSVLTDFDHESVFEAILLACADPTREVRAAAARGLFKLNFDRANAWKRIIETNDEFRMSRAARAALEAGIVVKSFERLIHEDRKVAYEAFCLVSLLIRSTETAAIFDAIRTHRDERVRFALLHVLKIARDERTLDELSRMQLDASIPTDVTDRIRQTRESFEMAIS